jgi:hypothetical protein
MIQFHPIKDKAQLVDALTGGPLDADAAECAHCGVFYNPESVQAINADNCGICISCQTPFQPAS